MHWATAVIYIRRKKIKIFDPKGANRLFYLKVLFKFVTDSWEKINPGVSFPQKEDWELVDRTNDIPIQRNEHDCGVFCCMYADYISNDRELNFSHEIIQQQRQFIKETIETINYTNQK